MNDFAGKHAVAVRGATEIGLAVSQKLVARGADILIAGEVLAMRYFPFITATVAAK